MTFLHYLEEKKERKQKEKDKERKKERRKKERKPLIVDKKAGSNRPMRRHQEFLVHDLMALIINV